MVSIKPIYNETMIELFQSMQKINEEFGLKRSDLVVLLKVLLEERDSVFYDCLCATSDPPPYKQIITDCDELLKEKKGREKDIEQDEKPMILCDDEGKEIGKLFMEDAVLTVMAQALYNVYNATYPEDLEDNEEVDAEVEISELEKANNSNLAIRVDSDSSEEKEANNEDAEIILDSDNIFEQLIINDTPKEIVNILKNNGVYIEGIREYYQIMIEVYDSNEINEVQTDDKIPMALADFVKAMSSKYKGQKVCEYLGRDQECKRVIRTLQKRGKKNVILVGPAGCGKSAIAEKIAFDIANGNVPESLKDKRMLKFIVNDSVAGTTYRGDAEKRFQLLTDYLEQNEDVILFIDEMHTVIGAGATSGHESGDLSNSLKPFLASEKARVIGATTDEEYERIISRDSAFKRRFQKVTVKEPNSKEVYPMLKNAIKRHEEYHGVTISPEMVEYAILISSCFNNTTCNPDRTNDLIDSAMVIAKENGKTEVDEKSILENFEINFEKFEKMDDTEKKQTAYHEAGHYLVWRMLGKQKDVKAIAISIMPAEDYLGVTVYDDLSDEVTVRKDKEYYKARLAHNLAGREAEKLLNYSADAGASQDLENANKLAFDVIQKLGITLDDDLNTTYYEDDEYHMMSDELRNKINHQKNRLIEEATKLAHDTLIQYRHYLDALVDLLIDKGIVAEKELDEIFND